MSDDVIFPTADRKEHQVNYIFVFWDITKYIRKHENDSTLSYLNWGFVDHSLVGLGKPSRGGQATRVVLLVGVGSAEIRTTLTVKEKFCCLIISVMDPDSHSLSETQLTKKFSWCYYIVLVQKNVFLKEIFFSLNIFILNFVLPNW